MTDPETIDRIAEMIQLEKEEISDIKELAKHVTDPVTVGLLVSILIEERKKTNRLLEAILKELRTLKSKKKEEIVDLSEADEKILELIKKRGMVTAEDVRDELGYKGLNGASARLNSLYKRGLLQKVRKGRKVYFILA